MDICKPNDDVMSHPQTTGHFPLLHVPPPDSNSSSHSTKKLAKSPNNGQYFVHDPYSWWIVCPTVCGSVCNDLLVAQAVLRGHWIQWCASRESPLACSLNYFYFTHNQQHSLVPCIRLVCFVTQWLLSEHWPCMLFDCWWHLVPPSKKKTNATQSIWGEISLHRAASAAAWHILSVFPTAAMQLFRFLNARQGTNWLCGSIMQRVEVYFLLLIIFLPILLLFIYLFFKPSFFVHHIYF